MSTLPIETTTYYPQALNGTKQAADILNNAEVQNLINQAGDYRKLKSINIAGFQFDIYTIIIFILSIVLWTILWLSFNIFDIVSYSEFFFSLYIIIAFINLINSSNDTADVETERVQNSSQQSYIQGSIAIFILAFIFLYNIEMENDDKTKVYTVLIICLIVSCLALIILDYKNNSENIRFIRKINQLLYNQSLVLFLLALFMIFFYKTQGSV